MATREQWGATRLSTAIMTSYNYGLTPVGTISLSNNEFKIAVTDPRIAESEYCIYAFVVGEEIVRIGSSEKIEGTLSRMGASCIENITLD